jgi:hypothetical protein
MYSIDLLVPRQLESNAHGGGASVWEFEALQVLETSGGSAQCLPPREGLRQADTRSFACMRRKKSCAL